MRTVQSSTAVTSTNTNKTSTTATQIKNAVAAEKEKPKRKAFDRATEDRSFFEGFYEVDGATTQAEREDRRAQVEAALRDMDKYKPGDRIRRTMQSIPQPYQAEKPPTKEPRAEFHAAPSWVSPLEESDDDIVKAGRKYAEELIDKQFRKGHEVWYLPYDNISPYEGSKLNFLDAKYDSTHRNIQNLVTPLQVATKAADIAVEYQGWKDYGMNKLLTLGVRP